MLSCSLALCNLHSHDLRDISDMLIKSQDKCPMFLPLSGSTWSTENKSARIRTMIAVCYTAAQANLLILPSKTAVLKLNMDSIFIDPLMNQIPPVDLCFGCREHHEFAKCLLGSLNCVYDAEVD